MTKINENVTVHSLLGDLVTLATIAEAMRDNLAALGLRTIADEGDLILAHVKHMKELEKDIAKQGRNMLNLVAQINQHKKEHGIKNNLTTRH